MSNYIDLDSTYRDVNTFPNPASYTVLDSQIQAWNRESRNVSANSTRPSTRSLDFTQTLRVIKVIIPYLVTDLQANPPIAITTANLQRLYLDVHTKYNDSGLISGIDNKAAKVKFVLFRKEIQNDANNNPVWIIFESHMHQVMRFSRNEPIAINITDQNFVTLNLPEGLLPPDPSRQTYILLETTPYFRDGEYQNQGVGLTQF